MTACGNRLSNPALERTAGSHPLAAAAHREPLDARDIRMARRDRRDCNGQRLRPGDRVRVLAVPDLVGMGKRPKAETARVFQHLVGTYRRIDSFDRLGFVRLVFRIRRGALKGLHWRLRWRGAGYSIRLRQIERRERKTRDCRRTQLSTACQRRVPH